MHHEVPSPDAYRHREHNVLEFLRRERARIWYWDVDVGDFRRSVNGLFTAERNDGCDALRIGMRQLLCVFEAAEIEAFPNLRHSSSLSATSPRRTTELCADQVTVLNRRFHAI